MLIRKATEHDTEEIIHIQTEIISANKYFISTTREISFDLKSEKVKMIQNNELGGLTLVAEKDAQVIGYLVFKRNSMKRLNHTGSFSIAIRNAFRDQGLGTQMLSRLLYWARTESDLEKICLGVLSTNERAIKVYDNLGFKEEGREIRKVKLENGQYVDNVLMTKFV